MLGFCFLFSFISDIVVRAYKCDSLFHLVVPSFRQRNKIDGGILNKIQLSPAEPNIFILHTSIVYCQLHLFDHTLYTSTIVFISCLWVVVLPIHQFPVNGQFHSYLLMHGVRLCHRRCIIIITIIFLRFNHIYN